MTRTPTANLLLFPSTELSVSSLFIPSLPSFLPLPLPLTWESFSVFATRASKAMSVFCCPAEMSLTQKCWIFEGIFKVSPLSLPLAHTFSDIFPQLQQAIEGSPWSILRFLASPWHSNEMCDRCWLGEPPASCETQGRNIQAEMLGPSGPTWCSTSVTWLLAPRPLCCGGSMPPHSLGRGHEQRHCQANRNVETSLRCWVPLFSHIAVCQDQGFDA